MVTTVKILYYNGCYEFFISAISSSSIILFPVVGSVFDPVTMCEFKYPIKESMLQ